MSTSTMTMTTAEIANRLVEFCKKGDFEGAPKESFADDAVSIEPYGTPVFEKETKGFEGILIKERVGRGDEGGGTVMRLRSSMVGDYNFGYHIIDRRIHH